MKLLADLRFIYVCPHVVLPLPIEEKIEAETVDAEADAAENVEGCC